VTDHLAEWDARIDRARQLAARTGAPAELLNFYGALATRQRRLAEQWAAQVEGVPAEGVVLAILDRRLVRAAVPGMLAWLGGEAPAGLQPSLARLAGVPEEEWAGRLQQYVEAQGSPAGADPVATFILESLVQPQAALLRARVTAVPSGPAHASSCCPRCGARPVAGVLREEGHGARRQLVCGLCLHEWGFLRATCVSCGEHRFEALPVFTAEELPLARVEACDTCRTYVKTLDGTRDGHVEAVVDDLATVAMDIWARGQGYARLRPSLLQT
jgi:FdhE protein